MVVSYADKRTIQLATKETREKVFFHYDFRYGAQALASLVSFAKERYIDWISVGQAIPELGRNLDERLAL